MTIELLRLALRVQAAGTQKEKRETITECELDGLLKQEVFSDTLTPCLGESEDVFVSGMHFCGLMLCFVLDEFMSVDLSMKIFEYLEQISEKFVKLRGRTCLALGGTVTSEGLVVKDDVPGWLSLLMKAVPGCEFQPNHALINVYNPGQGIMAHQDGPAYFPYAVILSLGSGGVFEFVNMDRKVCREIYVGVGSLLKFSGQAYTSVMHQFDARRFDTVKLTDTRRLGLSCYSNGVLSRGKRISITMRHVKPCEQ